MTDSQDNAAGSGGSTRARWVDDMQEALDRTGDAIRTAWEASRETRMSALESAKQAAQELGESIDKGIAAAKDRWSEGSAGSGATSVEEE
ncbi:MAG: hypothetical protein ACRDZM_10705 [Acidimicrobiia bacterium]